MYSHNVKAVLLDVDNTLLDFDKSAKATITAAFAEMGLPYCERVFDTFLRVNDALWRKIEKKEITRTDLHRDRWNIIFRELGIEGDGALAEKLFLSGLENNAVPVEGALDLVRYLSAKYALFTASNAPYMQQVKRLTLSGIMPYLTAILNFEELGINKPQKRFFAECLRSMRPATADQIVFIGDSLSADIAGGRAVGVTTVWFNHGGVKTAKPDICDFAVNSLAEIKDIL